MLKPSSTSETDVRHGFASAHGAERLYWRLTGSGGPTLVCCNGAGVGTFFWRYVQEHFSSDHRVLIWDYPGIGRSAKSARPYGVADCADYLEAVLEDAGIEQAIFVGHSMGTQVLLEHHRRYRGRALALVSVLGTFGYPLETFQGLAVSGPLFDIVLAAARRAPGLARILFAAALAPSITFEAGVLLRQIDPRASKADLELYFHQLVQMGPEDFCDIVERLGAHSAKDFLPEVEIPVLVVAGEFDTFTPPELSRELADALPQSALVLLKGASHAGLVEQPEVLNGHIEDFLRQHQLLP